LRTTTGHLAHPRLAILTFLLSKRVANFDGIISSTLGSVKEVNVQVSILALTSIKTRS